MTACFMPAMISFCGFLRRHGLEACESFTMVAHRQSTLILAGVNLEVLHTPGHSPDSISLFDRQANILFAADFVYPGPLYAQVPGANLADYLTTAEALLPQIYDQTKIFCAHGTPDEKGKHRAPLMGSARIFPTLAKVPRQPQGFGQKRRRNNGKCQNDAPLPTRPPMPPGKRG